ncbi:GntR family transcriptional regulator [Paraburkholderia tropica]|uniref:GntR family transcriptional regulator n=1 Tax=Paraburkholderia tropica TaxID=92647 RepID=UPI0009F22901|nr:GntR family transcriptional regulator [Paraburkholderia tropica]
MSTLDPIASTSDEPSRGSMVAALVERLKIDILNGTFKSGEFLRDLKMVDRYDVSRNTFRSAAQYLVSHGILRQAANRGFFVPEFGPDDIVDITRLRGVLEVEAVRLIVESGRVPDEALAAVDVLRNAPPDAPRSLLVMADRDFHRAIIASSGSPRLTRSYEMLESEIELLLVQRQDHYGDPNDIVREHEHLIACLRSRHFETARAAFVEHWEDLRDKLLRSEAQKLAINKASAEETSS